MLPPDAVPAGSAMAIAIMAATRTARCGTIFAMSLRILTWLYRKLGSFYPAAFMTVELQSAFVVTAATVALISLYYDASTDEFFQALVVVLALTALAVGYAMVR